ncbi:MAG: biosynthetic-type acetolactate synthase large subunit [Lachnospiraceae bacterium]|nr:biosynthetic-type acetolactate synthase large subunit [Lachnospiraceae bacterium]
MQLNGAQIVIECLLEQGVDTVFGYPGGTILNVYDELYQYQDRINHILTSHEQGAAHAADGYARATGKVGVCMATSGPGATNLITGIATAYMDSVPLVAITCNVGVSLLGKDSFQEIDVAGVSMPITKHNFIVKDINNLADTIRRAFTIAKTGRPGPVLVDITKDVTANKCTFEKKEPVVVERSSELIADSDIERAVKAIKKAKKPVILVGGGVVISKADNELAEFVEKVDAPVCDTLMGKGAYDNTKDNYMGMLGMHGTKTSNLSVSECDLLIAIGTRFSDRVIGNSKKFAHDAKKIHIDVDPAEINKNVRVDYSIIGDIKEVLVKLNACLEKQYHKEWIDKVTARKNALPMSYNKDNLTGPEIIEYIDKATNGDAIITTDVGQHQMWAAQYYKYRKPSTFLSSGGLGTMGYGLGACIGAKVGKNDKHVINIAGDGCFRMNINELATASRYNIPIIQIVLNNHVLGMVRQWQTLFYGHRYSNTILNDKVDFVKVSEGFGVKACKVTTIEEFKKAFDEALALEEPMVIECIIDNDDKVWPMVKPGDSIENVFSQEDLDKRD